jgi:hypothetical protein
MVPTTFVTLLLSLLPAGEALPNSPVWLFDYSKAMTTAVAQQKPLAVFIGKGETGYSQLISDGQIPAEALQSLSKNYVSVYVDTNTVTGKALASDFGVATGLVISNKGGSYQALRHTGTLTSSDLTSYLTRYSDVTTVTTTAERGLVPASALSNCPNGRCGTTVTTGSGTQYVYPSFYSTGGCPNGRCPNAR